MKNKEAIVEAFNRIVDSSDYVMFDYASFEEGAKWQQKQLLSLDKENLVKTDNDKLLYQIGVSKGMLQGIEFQQERSYSEEDMKLAFEAGHKKGFSGYPNTENFRQPNFEEFIKQFKNK